MVKLPEAQRRDRLCPRCFRRVARDDERLPTVLAGPHRTAFACLLLRGIIALMSIS